MTKLKKVHQDVKLYGEVSIRHGIVNPFKKKEFVCHSIEEKKK